MVDFKPSSRGKVAMFIATVFAVANLTAVLAIFAMSTVRLAAMHAAVPVLNETSLLIMLR